MFFKMLGKSVLLLGAVVIIIDILYPLLLWILAQVFFPFQANGSILYNAAHQAIGSILIAQPFTHDEYFHPRPSAAEYNAAASASSTLAPSNSKLRDRVSHSLSSLLKSENNPIVALVPADRVTTSASGLDPHITLQNAEYQLNRVAKKRATLLHRDEAQVKQDIEILLQQYAFSPLGGLAGEKLINVLEVNLALDAKFMI